MVLEPGCTERTAKRGKKRRSTRPLHTKSPEYKVSSRFSRFVIFKAKIARDRYDNCPPYSMRRHFPKHVTRGSIFSGNARRSVIRERAVTHCAEARLEAEVTACRPKDSSSKATSCLAWPVLDECHATRSAPGAFQQRRRILARHCTNWRSRLTSRAFSVLPVDDPAVAEKSSPERDNFLSPSGSCPILPDANVGRRAP